MPGLVGVLALVGLVLLLLAGRLRRASGLPGGRVVALDLHSLRKPGRVMTDPEWGLSGRPDYVLETPRGLLPVEVKTSRAPRSIPDSHLLQLAAYCRLIQAETGTRPGLGVLRYADRSDEYPYTPDVERELRRILEEIRAASHGIPDRSHASPSRCTGCGFREACDQSLSAGGG